MTQTTNASDWDYQHDVVIVGSGAGGMTAALIAHDLGLDAIVIEKSNLVGGTTAVSAGVVWIPDNPHLKSISYPDSRDDAATYLRETVGEDYDEEKIGAYLDTGPALVSYLEQHSEIAFRPVGLPDYYADLPGGKDGNRALDPLPLSARDLGEDIKILRPPHPQIVVGGMTFTTGEVAIILRKEPGWLKLVLKRALHHYLDLPWLVRHGNSPRLTLGNALVGRCMLSLKQRNIPIWRETKLKRLIRDETGVIGIVAERDGKEVRIKAKKGVILAAGGFGANQEMRKTYLTRSPETERSVAPDINMGDGISAGMELGADTHLMDEAWWIPIYRLRDSKLTCGMFMERSFPGSMIINRQGARYLNEAANYDDAGRAMANANSTNGPDVPSYFIFDKRCRENYIAGPLQPMPAVMDAVLSAETKDLVIKAPDLKSLAEKLNIDPVALENTVERFNRQALAGVDADFHRGEETYERHYSDPNVAPNSTMAPITEAPFYAIPIYAGDIGTKGGLVTDRDARVLDRGGNTINGLYAAGNTAASIMGRSYPGGGVTIGPSMVFGARAALHIAGKALTDLINK
ncbi:FAD-binding protein [Emcibacter nanhaiensis]|uniref:3-oxosteroid 1-dehydrogenase n=1 Tax=Emcibacter nanhaiensis TaxID=1505037 RepID=A0A501PIR5_9PROT|nr:FAD-binding protein [Emcibacter nanhaiensis]TPD59891.1 FAD-binding protein [Emcibacter nanhaiensis]